MFMDECYKALAQDLVAHDAKALGLIQNSVSNEIFPNEETAKAGWDILKQEY